MARSLALFSVLLLLLSTAAVAEEVRLPKPILDTEDLSIHVVETSCNSYLITCKRDRRVRGRGSRAPDSAAPSPRGGGGHTPKAIWITHEHGDHRAASVGDSAQR